jgi:dTDP-4-dehydrorhamnose reductase
MRVLVLGVSGMIGSTMFRVLSENAAWAVFGAARSEGLGRFFSSALNTRLITGIDVNNRDVLMQVFGDVRPDLVINCIGLTKHHSQSLEPLLATPINTLLPHRLANICRAVGARFIHVSTDCVFSGSKGNYVEDDAADADDVYGKSKFLGEISAPHAVTLRTSTIGHELQSAYGLLEWFLAQKGQCKGFRRAIFSGLPNVTFAQVVRDVVIPRAELSGIFHVGAEPISKYDLLNLIARIYGKSIEIHSDDSFVIDRSLNLGRFRGATGYVAPDWPELINLMHRDQQLNN